MDKKELRLRRSARKDSMQIEKLANEYNFQIVPRYFEDIEYDEEFTKIAVDKEGNVIGGCIGEIYAWGVLYVDTLWVDEKYRGKNIGSNLIEAVEDVGREKGCYLCFLGTLDVQARPFYEKQGYKLLLRTSKHRSSLFKLLIGRSIESDVHAVSLKVALYEG